jgi:hypothetical protein
LLLILALPRIGERPGSTFVETIHAVSGTCLNPGAKLVDLRVDLSAVVAHDCPPVSLYRIALRERVWLRRLDVAADAAINVGDRIALLTTSADEPLDATPVRSVRVTVVGIVRQDAWWKAQPS